MKYKRKCRSSTVLTRYTSTREPVRPMRTQDGQRIPIETMKCKVRCDDCGFIGLEWIRFVAQPGMA